jgi:hypothetical protein
MRAPKCAFAVLTLTISALGVGVSAGAPVDALCNISGSAPYAPYAYTITRSDGTAAERAAAGTCNNNYVYSGQHRKIKGSHCTVAYYVITNGAHYTNPLCTASASYTSTGSFSQSGTNGAPFYFCWQDGGDTSPTCTSGPFTNRGF